jgi:hypothetical protein
LETTLGALTAARDYFDRNVDTFFRQHVQIFPEGYLTLPYPPWFLKTAKLPVVF